MQSWPCVDIPRLPGVSRQLRLFDSASKEIKPVGTNDTAKMYVCGITPYDATHMGHANTYVAFDLVNRMWRDNGKDVLYVQNVTDIDDPLLERAVATGQDWREIADRETSLFREDMAELRVIPPAHYIGAVESIPAVAKYVKQLQMAGDAYYVDDDLYFSVHSDPSFGTVSGLAREEMIAIYSERGGDPERSGKADPLDCLVWQSARPNEPAWDSVVGSGRPGWHIECTAIALDYLGEQIDVQGGGSDLAFPHHEMGAVEAQRITGAAPFAQAYVHSGMVAWQGHKMSKSRGNLVFVSALRRSGTDPMAIRLALMAHHYRSNWSWTQQGMEGAESRLALWRAGVGAAMGPSGDDVVSAVRESLSQDLRTPEALDHIDEWARAAVDGVGSDENAPERVNTMVDALIGVRLAP